MTMPFKSKPSIQNTEITLPLLSALPSSTTYKLTQSILKQCWAESILKRFFHSLFQTRRQRQQRHEQSAASASGNANASGVTTAADAGTTSTTTTSNTRGNTTVGMKRSGYTATNHFLFHNLHSDNLAIRQSCIMTLLKGVKDIDMIGSKSEIDSNSNNSEIGNESKSGSDNLTDTTAAAAADDTSNGTAAAAAAVTFLENDQDDVHHNNDDKKKKKKKDDTTTATTTTSATTTTTTSTTKTKDNNTQQDKHKKTKKKKRLNYHMILRNTIWDMIHDDFQSFLHSSYLTLGGSTSTSTINYDFSLHGGAGEQYASTTTTTTTTTDDNNGGGNIGTGSGIIQLVGLFIYLLEDSDDHEESFFANDEDDDVRNSNSNSYTSSGTNASASSTAQDMETETTAAATTTTTTTSNHDDDDDDMGTSTKQEEETKTNAAKSNTTNTSTTTNAAATTTTPATIKKTDQNEEPSSSSSPSSSDAAGASSSCTCSKSALYTFVIKGGLKWISGMILRHIQLLLSLNHYDLSLSLPSSSPLQQDVTQNDSDDDDENENENSILSMKFASPSTLNKPRHYFHTLKQSSTMLLSNPVLERDILVRLSLLIDLFMRISFVGYLYPVEGGGNGSDGSADVDTDGNCNGNGVENEDSCDATATATKDGSNGSGGSSSSKDKKMESLRRKSNSLRKRLGRLSKRIQHRHERNGDNEIINMLNNSSNRDTDADADADEEMMDMDMERQQQQQETNEDDAISTFLNALEGMKNETSTTVSGSGTNNSSSSNIDTPMSTIDDNDDANITSNNNNNNSSASKISTVTQRSAKNNKMRSDKERLKRRTEVLQTIHQYIWRQSNTDTIIHPTNTSISNVTSTAISTTLAQISNVDPFSSSIQSLCTLSPLASLLTASFVLSTTTPPTPTQSSPSGGNSSGGRSFHSLSLFTSSLVGGLLPGSRFRSSNSGSGGLNSNSASVDTMPLFSIDYPILPGPIRTERIISYLNKLTDPMKDVMVIMKQKECGSNSNAKTKKGKGRNANDRKRQFLDFMAKKSNKRKARNDEDGGGSSSVPMGLESVLIRAGKRRRLGHASSLSDRAHPRSARLGASSSATERKEMEREEEEMSSSTARAILRAVVVGDRGGERGNISREMSPPHPFSLSTERSANDNVAELMARDMMESLLERRSGGGATISDFRSSSLDDTGFINVDLLDGGNPDSEQKSDNREEAEREEKENNDGDDNNDHEEAEDDEEDEDEDEDCIDDGNMHDMELVEADDDDDEEIDSDLEEPHKPMFGTEQDVMEDDDDMVENILVDDGDTFEVDEDDIMLVDGFANVRGLHSADQILANVIGASSSSGARRRNDSNASGGSGGSSPDTSTLNDKSKDWRKHAYIRAGMEVLEAQHPVIYHHGTNLLKGTSETSALSASIQRNETALKKQIILTPSAEQSLVQSICHIVKPPKKPLNLKVFMRRAPTQEEFFRGNVSRNPIFMSALKVEQGVASIASPSNVGSSSSDNNEPRVRDLRQHIANDLQMSDSAELLELLVANKILDMNLKLRVVSQTLWKSYLLENTSVTQSESSSLRHLIPPSGFDSGSRARIDENTPVSSLPPMVVTYRLAGVDGEATEDNVEVNDLVDPEAPPDTNTSQAEFEKQMEKEFGLTRLTTRGRGIHVLLRSIESYLGEVLQNVRRDDVGRRRHINGTEVITKNFSRDSFIKSAPCPTLTLLRHCAKLNDNRKKLLNAKAPTILLRLLLEVLNSIDESASLKEPEVINLTETIESSGQNSGDMNSNIDESNSHMPKKSRRIGNNPTADILQELIETLASDISTTESKSLKNQEKQSQTEAKEGTSNHNDSNEEEDFDESTLPMVLSSLTTTSLSPPLRKVIAKLLPFLTYGQASQSKALARHFITHINFECLSQGGETKDDNGDSKTVLMETFVDAAIHLPPVPVCDTLRYELIREGFVAKVKSFLLRDIPSSPPPWSTALFPKSSKETCGTKDDKRLKEKEWQNFYQRNGLQTGFNILIGLCKEHFETQSYVSIESDVVSSPHVSFLAACHWIEITSDNSATEISTNGLGILAETLLDTLSQDNEACETKIKELRKSTRTRKKELAQERRKEALANMSAFGRLVGDGAVALKKSEVMDEGVNPAVGGVFSAISNVFSGISKQSNVPMEGSAVVANKNGDNTKENTKTSKPAWMEELDEMEDEKGLTCAVCQEGITLQPTELLGLYAYVKKVSIPCNKSGTRGSIDGALLLLSLPYALPASLCGTDIEDDWFRPAKSAASALKSTPHGAQTLSAAASSTISARPTNYLTTVTAGNAIHCSCHARARAADRNHPKAPKSEWEGASLRNSRVSCNVILPLVSLKNSKIPVMSLENALADHRGVVSNLLGIQPKSMLWTMLHDIRLLLLRISYGETLNTDCGGGSLTSNSALIYYLLFMADLFARDAEHDSPGTVQHAKHLTSGFLAASSILRANDYKDESITSQRMRRGLADAAPMVSICCILFNNDPTSSDSAFAINSVDSVNPKKPNPKSNWELYKDHFLCSLIRHAGRRHALGIDCSGCESSRGAALGRNSRAASFNEWDSTSDEQMRDSPSTSRYQIGKRGSSSVEDYATALRPMITLFASLDQISKDLALNMDDEKVEEAAERLVHRAEQCQKADNIRSLLAMANISMDDKKIIEEIDAGIKTV